MREALIESFHAAVAAADPLKVVAEALPAPSGGRNCVVGAGKTVRAAQALAYARIAGIDWDGMQFRRDIGYRAIAREG